MAPTLDDVDRADEHLCCAPARESELMWKGTEPALPTVTGSRIPQVTSRHTVEQCSVPAQVFAMGDAQGDGKLGDGERPVHDVAVQSFSVDATPVTNADFERFVAATEFVTEAESLGFSAVFHLAVAAPAEAVMGPAAGTP